MDQVIKKDAKEQFGQMAIHLNHTAKTTKETIRGGKLVAIGTVQTVCRKVSLLEIDFDSGNDIMH